MTVIAVLPTPTDCSSSIDHATVKNSLENDKLNDTLYSLDRLSHKQAVKLHGDIFELRKEVYQRKKNALPLALRYTRHFDFSLGSFCSASSSEYSSLATSVQGSPSRYRTSLASTSLDLSSDWDDSNSSYSQSETCSSSDDNTSSSLRRRASRMDAAERAEDKRLENLHRRYASQLKTRMNGSVSRGCRVRMSSNV